MSANQEKIMQYVNTGEVRSGDDKTILNSGAIGSCVVITAFDPVMSVGAMAHVMLPGSMQFKNQSQSTIYAANAIDEMLSQLEKIGTRKENMDSVEKLLHEKQLEIKAKATGGFERRTVLFDIAKGRIYFTVGDSTQKILWQTMGYQK